jgi:chromosome segregation ATPase
MKQIEFENKKRELNAQRRQVMNQFDLMQNQIKEEIAEKSRQIHQLAEQVSRLKVQRQALHERRLKCQQEWADRMNKFVSENLSEAGALSDVSDWALARELHRRGFNGTLAHPDKTPEFLTTFNNRINNTWNEEDKEDKEHD